MTDTIVIPALPEMPMESQVRSDLLKHLLIYVSMIALLTLALYLASSSFEGIMGWWLAPLVALLSITLLFGDDVMRWCKAFASPTVERSILFQAINKPHLLFFVSNAETQWETACERVRMWEREAVEQEMRRQRRERLEQALKTVTPDLRDERLEMVLQEVDNAISEFASIQDAVSTMLQDAASAAMRPRVWYLWESAFRAAVVAIVCDLAETIGICSAWDDPVKEKIGTLRDVVAQYGVSRLGDGTLSVSEPDNWAVALKGLLDHRVAF